jgi:chromosome segregation ATPase
MDPSGVREELGKIKEAIELSVDVLREDIQEKATFYQTSINAAHEQIVQESEDNRETMKKDNEIRYDHAWKKVSEQLKDMEKSLKHLIEKRMNDIEKHMEEKTNEILKIAETGQLQSTHAVAQANQATEMSQQAIHQSKQAAGSAQNLVQLGQQQTQEFQSGVKTYESVLKQSRNQLRMLKYRHELLESLYQTHKTFKKRPKINLTFRRRKLKRQSQMLRKHGNRVKERLPRLEKPKNRLSELQMRVQQYLTK